MKPCFRNRKKIAWLAVGALDAPEAAALRDHFSHCEGCRSYWREISTVIESLAAAAPDSDLEATEIFHARVAAKLRSADIRSSRLNLWLREWLLDWRLALPATALLMMALLIVTTRHRPGSPLPVRTVSVASTHGTNTDPAPTVAYYEAAANQSWDKLDEVLMQQAKRTQASIPTPYTASRLQLAGAQ